MQLSNILKIAYFNQLLRRKYATGVDKATFTLKKFCLHRLDAGPSTEVCLTKDDGLKYYEKMYTIRKMETTASNMYKEKLIRGFLHLYNGHEAVGVGCFAVLRPDDCIITSYRCHGWVYLLGATPTEILSELAGKYKGISRGKGGSMHLYLKPFYGGNGIVGAGVPLGTGLAFSRKYLGKKNVCVISYGDGASNQGQVAESFNMAKLWNLPAVFLCENNAYGMGTDVFRSSANIYNYTRGDVIPGIRVDGMDVLAIKEALTFAINHCDADKGPIVIEAQTYRYFGHSMSDPGKSYRTAEEVRLVREKADPITLFHEKLTSSKLCTEDEIKNIQTKVKKEIDEAEKNAREDKVPPLDELTTDVYFKPIEKSIRNVTFLKPLTHKNFKKSTDEKKS